MKNTYDEDLLKVLEKIAEDFYPKNGIDLVKLNTKSFPGLSSNKIKKIIKSMEADAILKLKGAGYPNENPDFAFAFELGGAEKTILMLQVDEQKFNEMLNEQRVAKTIGNPWTIFQNDAFTLSYHKGSFFLNDEVDPFLSLKTEKIPRKLWNLAECGKKLFFSSEELFIVFDIASSVPTIKNAQLYKKVVKNHKQQFTKALEKALKEKGINHTLDLSETFFVMQGSNLYLTKKL